MKLLLLLLLWAGHSSGTCAEPYHLARSVLVHPPYHGSIPAKSDVIFSTRFGRPDAAEVAKAFGATRIEWVYTADPALASTLKGAAPWLGGTLNANGTPGGLPTEDGYARDFDGRISQPPWMKAWGVHWLSVAHPDARNLLMKQARRYVALNVDSIQFDDPMLQYYAASRQAGDFNVETLKGFPQFLAKYHDQQAVRDAGLAGFTGDYRQLLRERYRVKDSQDYMRRWRSFPSTPLWLAYVQSTVEEFFVELRRELRAVRGKEVPISMNLGDLLEPSGFSAHYFLAKLADYSMAESQVIDHWKMLSQAAAARALGLGLVASLQPRSVAENRTAIATFYALGAPALVPWDVYAGNDEKGQPKRYFGRAVEYADLYRFVRKNSKLLDGAETAAVVGLLVDVNRTPLDSIRAVVRRLSERQVPFAFIPTDGGMRYRLEAAKLRNLKAVVLPDDAIADSDRRALEESGLVQIKGTALDEARLESLRPFALAPGAERVRVFPRAVPGNSSRLVLHIVDGSAATAGTNEPACQRRLQVRRSFTGAWKTPSAHWTGPAGTAPVSVQASSDAFYVTLPTCPLWGILELHAQD